MGGTASHILKLAWASQHLNNLGTQVKAWFDADHYSSWTEPDPYHPDYLILKAKADEIASGAFSLLIGDCVQNLRSSLDHLAFGLASAFTNPLPEQMARESQFPIVGDRDRKGNTGIGPQTFKAQAHLIAGIDPAAKAIIEQLQPYHRGKDFEAHPLWRLHQLSNIDKHRVLHVAVASSHGMYLDPSGPINYTIGPGAIEVFPVTVNETETVIARIPVRAIDPKQEVQVNLKPAMVIAFSEGIAVNENACSVLEAISGFILTDVVPKLESYL